MHTTTLASQLDASPLFHIAFYKFAALPDPDAVAAHLRELTRDLTGSILVAQEGINGVLAGSAAALDVFEQALRNDAIFERRFADIVFKRSGCKTAPFHRIKVHVKKEIVALGVAGETIAGKGAGMDVSPADWRRLIAADDVVLIDNRNSFEFRLGRFKGAVDPEVANFRDFPAYLAAQAPTWKAEGKRVAMYCTGGIRCEKTSAALTELGIDIYQLEGGILNYFQAMPDAEQDWEGECFVFDNRIALDTKLQETATTAEDVYAGAADGEWRLARARRLDAAG
ncbi:MAG TPA: rhodanese-like domain-containing protein [Burkholderiaceae bacterium]|nr:rhodanese-like domain-containing protein [Burkholderiaceae bacterium]